MRMCINYIGRDASVTFRKIEHAGFRCSHVIRETGGGSKRGDSYGLYGRNVRNKNIEHNSNCAIRGSPRVHT